jgi:hypothetical protein
MGFGSLALAGLLARRGTAATDFALHGTAKVKQVIFAYMSGGVSHVDSFDPKPELAKRHGQPMPGPVRPTMFNNNGNIMATPWEAKPRGQSGIVCTDLFPRLIEQIDDLAIIRSMTSKASEHAQGNYCFHTGFPFMGHPSAGAWLSYGLGSLNENLPSFVVLQSGNAVVPHGGVGLYSSGFLPAQHQASILRVDTDEAMPNIRANEADATQRRRLDFIAKLDSRFEEETADAQVEGSHSQLRNCVSNAGCGS